MKEPYSLLKALSRKRVEEKALLPKGIAYQEYIVEVGGQEKKVFVPLRECDAFENSLSKIEELDEDELRNILRKHRGIKG